MPEAIGMVQDPREGHSGLETKQLGQRVSGRGAGVTVRPIKSQRRWSKTQRDMSWRVRGSRHKQRQSEEGEVIRDGQRQRIRGLIRVDRREARGLKTWSKTWSKTAREKRRSRWWE